MKPNEINLTLEQPNRTDQNLVLVPSPLIIDNSFNPVQPTSPATDALEFLTNQTSSTKMEESIDPHSLIIDLNDLLRRDPTLSSLDTEKHVQPMNIATLNTVNQQGLRQGVAIPGSKDEKTVLLKIDENQDLLSDLLQDSGPGVEAGNSVGIGTASSSGGVFDHGSSFGSISPSIWNAREGGQQLHGDSNQLTLTQLNSPTDTDLGLSTASGSNPPQTSIKMEINNEFDDLDLFLTNSSPNVSFGVAQPQDIKPTTSPLTFQSAAVKQEILQPSVQQAARPTTFTPLMNPNFWQANTDEMLFGGTMINTSGGNGGPPMSSSGLLSSSVPALFPNPLSDILTELTPNPTDPARPASGNESVSPHTVSEDILSPLINDPSPSQVGPTRHSTLHRLLMQRKGEAQGVKARPSPVRSPEGRKTLDQLRNSLSTSSTLMLSRSAPTTAMQQIPTAAAAGGEPSRNMWTRREPRPHINSVCSVGDASSIADEVNDVLAGFSPSDDRLDDEDEEGAGYYKDSSDDDSDTEGTSPSLAKLSTSAGSSSGGSKKAERHFWQYNVQAKGPKGQKIMIETKMEDPHVLNDIVDPVFSGDVQLQGIKHSGKARRGDGNDLTPNPRKLAAIGKELDHLSRIINDMTPVSEMPFGARCKTRKEKNKLASRACRLKKKAQHEANKVKCAGLLEEHRELSENIKMVKEILDKKMDIHCTIPQPDLTAKLDQLVEKALKKKVAGNTTSYVNDQIARNLPYV